MLTFIAWVLLSLLGSALIAAGVFAVLWIETMYRLKQQRARLP